jgi:hypothetical protein
MVLERSVFMDIFKGGSLKKCPKCEKEVQTLLAFTGTVRCSNCGYIYLEEEIRKEEPL